MVLARLDDLVQRYKLRRPVPTNQPMPERSAPSDGSLTTKITTDALAREISALGLQQANALEGPSKVWLLMHFRDPRILRGDIDQMRECVRWIPRGATVMDWGCGPALPSLILSRLRPDLVLRASNFDMELQTYKILWDAAGLKVDRLEHAWKLPFPDDSFDAVISRGVLEHVPNEQMSLAEIFRVLRHEGKFIVSGLPAQYSLLEWFNRVAGRLNHPRRYTLAYSKKLLMVCGFHVVWSAFRCSCPQAIPWADPLFRVWERIPIGRHLTQNLVLVGAKSVRGMGDQIFARHNLASTLRRIESGGTDSR